MSRRPVHANPWLIALLALGLLLGVIALHEATSLDGRLQPPTRGITP